MGNKRVINLHGCMIVDERFHLKNKIKPVCSAGIFPHIFVSSIFYKGPQLISIRNIKSGREYSWLHDIELRVAGACSRPASETGAR